MNNKKDIEKIVIQCVKDINITRINKKKINTNLKSDMSVLDSLGIVMLSINIEEKISEKYLKDIKLNSLFSNQKNINLNDIIIYINEKI
jgi:hypothetical protein